jgi:hypothetical protein
MIRANFLAAPFALEDPQLRRPIRQGQAKPVDVGIAREQFRDNRDLAVAAIDSCRYLNALGFDLIERPGRPRPTWLSWAIVVVSGKQHAQKRCPQCPKSTTL